MRARGEPRCENAYSSYTILRDAFEPILSASISYTYIQAVFSILAAYAKSAFFADGFIDFRLLFLFS